MLWNTIFDFFIKNIFGGVTTGGLHYYAIFSPYSTDFLTTDNVYVSVPLSVYGQTDNAQFPLGNYFAFIATIITLVIILALCCLFVYKIIKLIGGLITR